MIVDKLENSLSMEQKLNHRIFSDRVKQLSREEAIDLLVQMHKQMMFKDNLYKELFFKSGKRYCRRSVWGKEELNNLDRAQSITNIMSG